MEHAAKRPKYLADHFSDPVQQRESAKLGMWLFLLTEILLFGGLFVAYAVYRAWYPELFLGAHKYLDVTMGAINTVVLITSSVTVALSIYSIQKNRVQQSKMLLLATILLAGVFLVIKYFEYSHKIHLGLLPGKYFSYTGLMELANPHVFFSIYFVMTGIHGLHVIIGMVVLGWVYMRMSRGEFSSEYYTPVELSGLYWHLVDLIWIYLFPLLYLIH